MEYCSSFATDFSFHVKDTAFSATGNGFGAGERKNLLTNLRIFIVFANNPLVLCCLLMGFIKDSFVMTNDK